MMNLRIVILAAALVGAVTSASAGVKVTYRYRLADFGGPMKLMSPRLRLDGPRNEVYLLDGNTVRLFNASGMETYSFMLDPDRGRALDIAIQDSGDMILLCGRFDSTARRTLFTLLRTDYRGLVKGETALALPAELADFIPNYLEMREGRSLVLVSGTQYKLVELALDGTFVRSLDFAPLLGLTNEDRGSVELGGFAFGPAGQMLFTLPTKFKVVAVNPDGTSSSYGRAGSAPGLFGVVTGIAADARGNIFVADKQRSVVMVFDSSFRLVREFGGYGDDPENLIRPDQVVIAPAGTVYITQMKKRGVSVFDSASE